MLSILRKSWLPIGWLLLIHILLLFPHSRMPEEKIELIPHFDKLVHFGFYFGVVFICSFYFFLNGKLSPRQVLKCGLLITALAIADGILIEILQRTAWVNRDFDWFDMLADSIGAIAGLAALLLASARYRAQKKPL